MWLRANKISLNVEKIELIVFQRQNTKLHNSFKTKLGGKRLFSTVAINQGELVSVIPFFDHTSFTA